MLRLPFKVTRAGMPIDEYPLKEEVDTQIQYGPRFAEIDACIAAGLDLWRWDTGIYPIQMKTEVMAWRRMSGVIKSHAHDAVNRKIKRK